MSSADTFRRAPQRLHAHDSGPSAFIVLAGVSSFADTQIGRTEEIFAVLESFRVLPHGLLGPADA